MLWMALESPFPHPTSKPLTVQPFEYIDWDIFKSLTNHASAVGARHWGAWRHATPKILKSWCSEMLAFWEWPFLSKMFTNLIAILMLIFICVASHKSTQFYFMFCVAYLSFLGSSVLAKYTLLGVNYCNKNNFKNNRTDAKIRIFPIPIAYCSGFGIFKQNQENIDKVTLKMTTTQVVEMSVTVNNNSPIQDYAVHPDDHTQPTYEMTPGFKPFTRSELLDIRDL